MQRDFCLSCGAALTGRPCSCGLDPDRQARLERQEQDDLSEFSAARPLTMRDMGERVFTDHGLVSVAEWLAEVVHPDAIRELGVRRTDGELLQVVYQKGRGSRLYRWRLE